MPNMIRWMKVGVAVALTLGSGAVMSSARADDEEEQAIATEPAQEPFTTHATAAVPGAGSPEPNEATDDALGAGTRKDGEESLSSSP